MNKFLLLIVSILSVVSAYAQTDGTYSLYAYDKTNSANIYIPLTTTDNDMYSATGYTFNGSTDLSSIQVVYGNWAKVYAPAANTWPEVKLGETITLQEGGSGSGWVYGWTLASTNYVYFQLSTLKLAISADSSNPITGAASVSDVNASSNVAPVYYNLQGVKVSNPEGGLFIKKVGDKVSKVYVK